MAPPRRDQRRAGGVQTSIFSAAYMNKFRRTFTSLAIISRAYAYNEHPRDDDKRSTEGLESNAAVGEAELRRQMAAAEFNFAAGSAMQRESEGRSWSNAHYSLIGMLERVSKAYCETVNERISRVETILGTDSTEPTNKPLSLRMHQLELTISRDIDSIERSKTRPLIERIIEFEASASVTSQELREFTSTFNTVRQELSELKTTAAADRKDKDELKIKLDQERTKRFDAISEKANALREVEQLKRKSAELEEEVTSVDNNRQKISRNYKSSLESNSRLTAENAELEGIITSLNLTLREAEMTCKMPSGLSEDVRPAERLSRLLDYQRHANSNSFHALQEQPDDACANSARLTTDLHATIRDQKYDIQDSVRDAAEINATAQDQCGRMQVRTQTSTDVQTALTKALLRKRKLRAEVRRLKSTNARVRSEVKKKNAQVRQCKEKCDAEVTRLTESHHIALEEMAGLQKQSLRKIGIQHQTERDAISALKQHHQDGLFTKHVDYFEVVEEDRRDDQIKLALEELSQKHAQQINELQHRTIELKEGHDRELVNLRLKEEAANLKTSSKIQTIERELHAANALSKAQEEELQFLQDSILATCQRTDEMIHRVNHKIKELEVELDVSNSLNHNLQDELGDLQDSILVICNRADEVIRKANRRIDDLEKELDTAKSLNRDRLEELQSLQDSIVETCRRADKTMVQASRKIESLESELGRAELPTRPS